jgi:hypothetical protein
MLGAEHPSVPTEHMPGVAKFAHFLGDVALRNIIGVFEMALGVVAVLEAVDEVVDAGADAAVVEIGNREFVVIFHVVDDTELMAVAAAVPFCTADWRDPMRRRIVRLSRSAENEGHEDQEDQIDSQITQAVTVSVTWPTAYKKNGAITRVGDGHRI